MEKSELLESTQNNELMRFLGVEIVEASAERVVMTMPVTPKVHQYVGIMNGGVSLYLFETAASIGVVVSSDLTKVTPVGIEINANHMRAVSKGILTVTATPIRHGKTLSVWKVENHDERGKLVCTGRISILLQNRPAFPVQE
jgi:uncharacterized protein (TIGR00369 family)